MSKTLFCGTAVEEKSMNMAGNSEILIQQVEKQPATGKQDMKFQALKCYLQGVYVLEKQLYELKKWKAYVEKQMTECQSPVIKKMQEYEKKEVDNNKSIGNEILAGLIAAIISSIMFLVIGVPTIAIIVCTIKNGDGIFFTLMGIVFSPLFALILVIDGIISWGLSATINMFYGRLVIEELTHSKIDIASFYMKICGDDKKAIVIGLSIVIIYLFVLAMHTIDRIKGIKVMKRKVEARNLQIEKNNRRIANENEKIKQQNEEERRKVSAIMENLRSELIKTQNDILQTENTLDIAYKKAVLDKVYWHDFVAICSFYGYIKMGRSRRLEVAEQGADVGIYNLYENEKRQNLIITNLQEVNRNLERIERRQQELYYAIQEVNQNLSFLSSAVQNLTAGVSKLSFEIEGIGQDVAVIKENSELSAYHNGITANNIKVLKDIELYREMWR